MLARAVASPLLRRTAALPIAATATAIATPTLTSPSLLRYSQPRRWQSSAKPPKGPGPSAGKDTKPDSHSTTQRPSQPDPEASNTDLPNKDAPNAKDENPDATYDPSMPLPDLTKGIPSTLFDELASKREPRRPGLPNLTEDPYVSSDYTAQPGAGAGRGGAGGDREIPRDGYVSSTDRRRDRMASITYGLFWTSAAAFMVYLGRNWADEEEEKKHAAYAPSGWTPQLWWARVKARYDDITSYYKDPPFQKLLPDEDPSLRQPYTLVISLEDLLVHNEWSREHGWRLAKRPGVDYFLRYLNQYYELVLFTSVPVMQADQVLRKLDPFRIIRWPLGREAAKYEKGEYIKDLSYLNRDLSKVIMIDTDPSHAKHNPENAIILPKWRGQKGDKDLVALIPFLEYIAGVGIDDVRTVIKSFEGTHIPTEFARREKIMREKWAERVAEDRKNKPKRSVGGIAALFGVKPPAQDPVTGSMAGEDPEKMILDLIRERGQRNYEFMDREIRVNGPKWLAEMEAEEEKMRQLQVQSMKQGFFGSLGLGGGGGGEQQQQQQQS